MYSRIILMSSLLIAGSLLTLPSLAQAQRNLTKQVNKEVAAQKGAVIHLAANAHKITVKSWDQPLVRVSLELSYDSSLEALSDEEWITRLRLDIKSFGDRVDISRPKYFFNAVGAPLESARKKKELNDTETKSKSLEEVVVLGKPTNTTLTKKESIIIKGYVPSLRSLTIMIPSGCKLDIENNGGDIVIETDVEEARLNITNGVLDAQHFKTLNLTGSYCLANIGNVEKATLDFSNGSLRALEIKELEAKTQSANIEYEKGSYLYLKSERDHYTIDAIDKIDGHKSFGSMYIYQLNKSLDVEGDNSDIKLRRIAPTATLIKISDRYADIRVPVRTLKNYMVEFNGNYSTVFAPFIKEAVKEEEKKEVKPDLQEVVVVGYGIKKVKGEQLTTMTPIRVGESAPAHFTGSAGDVKGQHTAVVITCHSCTVDFK